MRTVTLVWKGTGKPWAVGAHSRTRYEGRKINAHPRDVYTLIQQGWEVYEPPKPTVKSEVEPGD